MQARAWRLRAVHALLCVLPRLRCAALCASAPRVPPRPDGFQLGQLTPQALAYVGDAVFELHARDALLWPPRRMNAYSSEVLELARAEGQFELLKRLEADFALTDDEREWMRRGRNAAGRGPQRLGRSPRRHRARVPARLPACRSSRRGCRGAHFLVGGGRRRAEDGKREKMQFLSIIQAQVLLL